MRKLVKKYVIYHIEYKCYVGKSYSGSIVWKDDIQSDGVIRFNSEDEAESFILDNNGSYKGGLRNADYQIIKIYVKTGEKED